jgi:hypothetical protein
MSHVGELIGVHVHTGEKLSEDEKQHLNNKLNAVYGDKTAGNHYYLRAKGDSTSPMELGTYVNPQLALHTDYFGSLDRMMRCVEKHAHTDAKHFEKVCSKEMNELRKNAF